LTAPANFNETVRQLSNQKIICPIPDLWVGMFDYIFDRNWPADFDEIKPLVFAGWSSATDEELKERFLLQLQYLNNNNLTAIYDQYLIQSECSTQNERWYLGGKSIGHDWFYEDYEAMEQIINEAAILIQNFIEFKRNEKLPKLFEGIKNKLLMYGATHKEDWLNFEHVSSVLNHMFDLREMKIAESVLKRSKNNVTLARSELKKAIKNKTINPEHKLFVKIYFLFLDFAENVHGDACHVTFFDEIDIELYREIS